VNLLKKAVEDDLIKPLPQQPGNAVPHDFEPITQAVKIDTMIGSLSEAIREQEKSEPLPPEFTEIVNELNLIEHSGEISEEAAKKALIGRDGLEFMKSIKRLYLN
jgi:hypothetical protein